MRRLFTLLCLILLLAIVLLAVGNAPRVAEARAHEAAARTMEAQATVTGMAVGGLLFLAVVLVLTLMAIIGLLSWLLLRRAPAYSGHTNSGEFSDLPVARRRRRISTGEAEVTPELIDEIGYPLLPYYAKNFSNALADEVNRRLPAPTEIDWETWEERPWDY